VVSIQKPFFGHVVFVFPVFNFGCGSLFCCLNIDMRIVWLSHLLPYPPTAGVMMRSYYLLKALASHSEVHFVSLVQPRLLQGSGESLAAAVSVAENELASFCASVTVVRDPGFEGEQLKYKALFRSLLSGRSFSEEWARSNAYRRSVRSIVSRVCPDIVHIDTISLAQYCGEVGDYLSVLNHHNIESHLMKRRAKESHRWVERVIFSREARLLERWEGAVCDKLACNVVCSDLDGERLREHVPGAEVAVVPNCLPVPSDPSVVIERDPFALCFIGTMSWRPNAEAARYLVDKVWPRIRESDPRYRLHILGRDPDSALRQSAVGDNRMEVHGFVPSTEEMFRSAGVFVCPITDGGGTKLKLIEAMAYALPIVAHPVACEGLGLVDGESVLYAREPEEFVDAVQRLAMNRELAQSMASRAHEHFVANLSVDAVAGAMIREYSKIYEKKVLCAASQA
jgi:polysaccharide biosynthesis protein PslH